MTPSKQGYERYHPTLNPADCCPYKIGSIQRVNWMDGWYTAELNHIDNQEQVQETDNLIIDCPWRDWEDDCEVTNIHCSPESCAIIHFINKTKV